MRFSERLASEDNREAYLIKATDIGNRQAYYVLFLKPEMKDAFSALKPNDPADLNDYGTIVASGFGDLVPDNVKATLMTRYKIKVEG